jgi:hypothetical protein
MWYVLTFFAAYAWAFAVKVLESMGLQASNEASIFPLLMLQAFFLPFQGVFNLIVYTRPNFIRKRQEFPDEPFLYVLNIAWFGAPKSQLTSVDASLFSNAGNARSVWNVDQARALAASNFTAVISTKDPLRTDFGVRAEASKESGLSVAFELSANQIIHSQPSSLHDDCDDDDSFEERHGIIMTDVSDHHDLPSYHTHQNDAFFVHEEGVATAEHSPSSVFS